MAEHSEEGEPPGPAVRYRQTFQAGWQCQIVRTPYGLNNLEVFDTGF